MKIICPHCGKAADKPPNSVNRARRDGVRIFCSRRCSNLGRRKHIPKSVRRLMKAAYDKEYRAKNLAEIKAKKQAYNARTYDPEKARIERKAKMPRHVEYCRRPEYKRWKSEYDRKRRDAAFGPFAEAARLCIDLNREIKGRMTNHEIKWQNGTSNKTQFRRRAGAKDERSRTRPRFRDRRHDHSSAHG